MNQELLEAANTLLYIMVILLAAGMCFMGLMIGIASTLMDIRQLLREQNALLKERLPND